MKLDDEPHSFETNVQIPCGRMIDLERPRSDGVLNDAELSFCRANDIPLAYDPTQIGWLPASTLDDFNVLLQGAPRRRAVSHNLIAHKTQINALHPQYRMRAWEPYDLEVYKALLDDPEVWRFMPEDYPDPLTEETAAALIELSNASNHHQVLAVLRDSKTVGQVRLLYDVDDADPTLAEISYWLGRAYWGKRIGSDIVSLFTDRCFADNPGITTLVARAHRDNAASSAVLEKSGYAVQRIDPKDPNWIIYAKSR